MKKKWWLLILPVAVIVLECLPFGAVLNFLADPQGEVIRQTYSYFSLTPFGYANFGPLLTALLSCVATAVLAVMVLGGKNKLALTVFGLYGLASACSLGPLILGVGYFSITGGLISAGLIVESFLLFRCIPKD